MDNLRTEIRRGGFVRRAIPPERRGDPYNTGDRSPFFVPKSNLIFHTRATSNGRRKKEACYSPLTSVSLEEKRGGKGDGTTPPVAFLHAPAAHARDRFITFHVHLTLANVCFTPVLCPRKHLQHSSSVYLRDTGYTSVPESRVGKLNTRWAENAAPPCPPEIQTRASQKFGPSTVNSARRAHACLAFLSARFNKIYLHLCAFV